MSQLTPPNLDLTFWIRGEALGLHPTRCIFSNSGHCRDVEFEPEFNKLLENETHVLCTTRKNSYETVQWLASHYLILDTSLVASSLDSV